MKSYCVKQKKQTEYVPGSERYMKAKNRRNMMKMYLRQMRNNQDKTREK